MRLAKNTGSRQDVEGTLVVESCSRKLMDLDPLTPKCYDDKLTAKKDNESECQGVL